MGVGAALLNWGILVLGIVLFLLGFLFMVQYGRAYEQHVLRYGRVRVGKKYGTSWNRADTRGVFLGLIYYIVGIPVVVGVLLFFLTGLAKTGIPLWVGVTLSISGILLWFLSFILGAGLAKIEVDTALSHRIEDEEQHQDDSNE
jgi:hypothetical protein